MTEQIDLFGESVSIEQVAEQAKRKSSGKLSIKERFRMYYGFDHDHICKDCKHLVCNSYNQRNYYKCRLMGISSSEATDIRLKDVACGMWEKEE